MMRGRGIMIRGRGLIMRGRNFMFIFYSEGYV